MPRVPRRRATAAAETVELTHRSVAPAAFCRQHSAPNCGDRAARRAAGPPRRRERKQPRRRAGACELRPSAAAVRHFALAAERAGIDTALLDGSR
jgi:nitroreductase